METEDYAYLYALEDDYWWFAGMREVTATFLDPFCSPGSDRMLLDAGCGTGGLLSWLTRFAGDKTVAGIDLSKEALNFCRDRGHKCLAQASVTDLPFADSVFDLVTSFDVLVQLAGPDADLKAMSEMHRVLRPGGLIFVRVAAYDWMRSGHDKALGTQRRYGLGGLIQRLNQVGFRVLRGTYANSLLFPVAMLRRLVLKPIGLADPGSDVKPLPRSFRWLNRAMTNVLVAEARFLKHRRTRLPAGLSAICVAEKPLQASRANSSIASVTRHSSSTVT